MKLLAAIELGTFQGLGPLGTVVNNGQGVFGQFENLISVVIGVMTVSAGLWFVFQLFGGALQWLASGGEKQALQNAQKRIVNALIGLILVIVSYVIIAIISSIFGLYILSPWQALQGGTPPNFSPGGIDPGCVPGQPC